MGTVKKQNYKNIPKWLYKYLKKVLLHKELNNCVIINFN